MLADRLCIFHIVLIYRKKCFFLPACRNCFSCLPNTQPQIKLSILRNCYLLAWVRESKKGKIARRTTTDAKKTLSSWMKNSLKRVILFFIYSSRNFSFFFVLFWMVWKFLRRLSLHPDLSFCSGPLSPSHLNFYDDTKTGFFLQNKTITFNGEKKNNIKYFYGQFKVCKQRW